MLKLFRVSNFKSLINVEVRPTGLNLLVGPNNAGKTNLCHALRFLALTSRMSLDDAARHCTAEPWNLLNVYGGSDTLEVEAESNLTADGEQLDYVYSLKITGRKNAGSRFVSRPFEVAHECLKVTGGPWQSKVLMENQSGKVHLLHEKRALSQASTGQEYVDTVAPTDTTMLCRLFDLETNQRANLFKRYLNSWAYYNFDPSELRSNVATPMDRVLDATGTNLCSVLYTLHNERPRDEKKLVEAAKVIEPKLDLISFHAPDPDHVYMFFEDKEGHRFGVQNLSDGTLRFLAICYLIIANRCENAAQSSPPLVTIEEPENGIFVGHLKSLFEKLDPNGASGQFLFTSHNPYFIDLFDGNLDGLHIVKAGATHSVLSKPDTKRVQDLLGKFSLGELHFRGLLE